MLPNANATYIFTHFNSLKHVFQKKKKWKYHKIVFIKRIADLFLLILYLNVIIKMLCMYGNECIRLKILQVLTCCYIISLLFSRYTYLYILASITSTNTHQCICRDERWCCFYSCSSYQLR